jgi:hypothetical protein
MPPKKRGSSTMTIQQEQEKPPEKRQAEGGGGGGNCEKDEDCKKGYKCLKPFPDARLGKCVPDNEHAKHLSNTTILEYADNTIRESQRTITNNKKIIQETTIRNNIKNEEDEEEMKRLEEQIRNIKLRKEAREKDLEDKKEETKKKEEEMEKVRNAYKITDQQMRNRYAKYGIQHPDDMSACPVCQENIPDAEIEEGISNKSLLRTYCCNQIIHEDCAVNHWSNVDYSRWQRCPACQNTPEWVRLINETEGRDPNSSVSNTRDFLLDRSRRGEQHQRNNLPIPLPTRETPAIQPQDTENEFIIPAHNNPRYNIAVGEFEDGDIVLGETDTQTRYRRIDYQSLREEDHPRNTPYNYNFMYNRERPRNVDLAIDSNGIIRNMLVGGRRYNMAVEYDAPFNEFANRHVPPIFTHLESIPLFVDNHRYAYHRDTLQLLGFINHQGFLRLRSDIQRPIRINEEMIQPADEIEGRIIGRGGDVFTYPTQTIETNNRQTRIEYNRVVDTIGNNSIYILRIVESHERGTSDSNWEVEPRVWERINLNEIERYIPAETAIERPYGWNSMGIIQIYNLLARYSSFEPDRTYDDNAFRDTDDPDYNEMVRRMLSNDYDDRFRYNHILIATNNRAYSYDSRQYLGEIHNLERMRGPGYNTEDQLSYYVEINRNTIRYLYNEIFLPRVNRDRPTQQVTQDNINEHPFRPYTDERNNNEIVGFDNITTRPMRHIRVGRRDVYSTMITGIGNDVFLTATMENNIVEAGIILTDEITVNNFQDLWEEERDEIGVITYGEWLDDHNFFYFEDMDEDEAVFIDMYNTMSRNPRFRERRLYIEANRLYLFDGETHRYLGSTYENDPSDIVVYIYENVYRQLFPDTRGGKRRKTLKKRRVIKRKSLKKRKVVKKKSLRKRKVVKKNSLKKRKVIKKKTKIKKNKKVRKTRKK